MLALLIPLASRVASSKTIPTQLGKDAILEAEIEIRAYRDKTHNILRTGRPTEELLAAFPLPEAFEVRVFRILINSSTNPVYQVFTPQMPGPF